MKQSIKFTKMHGLGNDYIYIDHDKYPITDPEAFSLQWSRPHTGIGSDGLVLISKEPDMYRMRIFNNDGSEAMMCGNGIRCVGKYLYDRGMVDSDVVNIVTNSGVKQLKLTIEEGRVVAARVDMNPPVIDPSIDQVQTSQMSLKGIFVSMGNPHWITFLDSSVDDFPLTAVGPEVECDKLFPHCTNFEVAEVLDRSTIKMRVWERGSGITMACGTGACATAVAAIYQGRVDSPVTVMMPGGDLVIEWDGDPEHSVLMTGPAEQAFEGELEM